MQYAYIYIFQKTAYVRIYLEERKNRQLFVDQFSTYTYHLVHEFDLRSPISCKKIFYICAILIFRRFRKIMETRSVLIVCTYVRTYCTCVNYIYSVHIYNFRESAYYVAYIYNFFLHMGQRRKNVCVQSSILTLICLNYNLKKNLKICKITSYFANILNDDPPLLGVEPRIFSWCRIC